MALDRPCGKSGCLRHLGETQLLEIEQREYELLGVAHLCHAVVQCLDRLRVFEQLVGVQWGRRERAITCLFERIDPVPGNLAAIAALLGASSAYVEGELAHPRRERTGTAILRNTIEGSDEHVLTEIEGVIVGVYEAPHDAKAEFSVAVHEQRTGRLRSAGDGPRELQVCHERGLWQRTAERYYTGPKGCTAQTLRSVQPSGGGTYLVCASSRIPMQSDQITQVLIILILFGSAAVAVRAVADALVRYRILREGVPLESVQAVQEAERVTLRLRALRLGLIAMGEAGALVVIGLLRLPVNSAGAVGALLFGLGVAQLAFFALTTPARQ